MIALQDGATRGQPSHRHFNDGSRVPDALFPNGRVLPGEVGGHQGCHKLRRFAFRSGAEYSYPASCVKLGAAMAALAFIREARAAWGVPVQPCSRLAFHYSLPTSQGLPSSPHPLQSAFVVCVLVREDTTTAASASIGNQR